MTEEVIKTERLTLRPLRATDAKAVIALAGDADVARMTARIPHPYTMGDADQWIARAREGEEIVFAILHDGALIGCAGYMPEENGCAEFGYWIGKPYWNRGFATEAVRAVAEHAFASSEIRSLTAGHFADNPASGRVLEKLGFAPAGEGHWECVARGEDVPCVLYRLERAGLQAA
jgi:RimJ/RimL family protein N-acetyltransferase